LFSNNQSKIKEDFMWF